MSWRREFQTEGADEPALLSREVHPSAKGQWVWADNAEADSERQLRPDGVHF